MEGTGRGNGAIIGQRGKVDKDTIIPARLPLLLLLLRLCLLWLFAPFSSQVKNSKENTK